MVSEVFCLGAASQSSLKLQKMTRTANFCHAYPCMTEKDVELSLHYCSKLHRGALVFTINPLIFGRAVFPAITKALYIRHGVM